MAKKRTSKKNARSNRTLAMPNDLRDLLSKTADHAGISGNKLIAAALRAALSPPTKQPAALRAFAAYLASAAEIAKLRRRSANLAADAAQAERAAVKKLKAASGDPAAPPPPQPEQRQSA